MRFAPASYAQSESDQPNAEQVQQETQELLSSVKSCAVDKKDDVVAFAKSVMENLDQRINAIEARIDQNWSTMSEAHA